jgi:hypothetical protein
MSPQERSIAQYVVSGATGSEAEAWWVAKGSPPRQLWAVLDRWAARGWWDYGVSIRGGWLTESGREALLRRTG